MEICCPLQEDARNAVTQDPPSANEWELPLGRPQLWGQERSPRSPAMSQHRPLSATTGAKPVSPTLSGLTPPQPGKLGVSTFCCEGSRRERSGPRRPAGSNPALSPSEARAFHDCLPRAQLPAPLSPCPSPLFSLAPVTFCPSVVGLGVPCQRSAQRAGLTECASPASRTGPGPQEVLKILAKGKSLS